MQTNTQIRLQAVTIGVPEVQMATGKLIRHKPAGNDQILAVMIQSRG